MFPVLTLSSRKLRYSLPNEPSGIDAISSRSSVARRILGLSLSITSHGKPTLDQRKPKGQSWEGASETYLRIMWPSGSFLILFLRFTNARCPVVSPSTATMSVLGVVGWSFTDSKFNQHLMAVFPQTKLILI